MPSTKRFEAYTLSIPMELKHIDMYEMSKQFYQNIENVYKYLDEDKKVSVEVPNDETLYRIEKEGSEHFKITDQSARIHQILEPIEFVNWLFAKAPFIAMVGYSNI